MPACDPLLKQITMYSHGAEIGVARGESSERFIRDRWCKMLLVDPWRDYEGYVETLGSGDAWNDCMQRLRPLRDYWIALRMKSKDAANAIPRVGSFDFVFIDGNHQFEYVLEDCREWWGHVRAGGMLCGHDWNLVPPQDHDVQRAVLQFAAEKGNLEIKVWGDETELQCWSIRKPEAAQ